ncbi:hypothetical protein GW17_00021904 [Ensete ventricosum]|nr:hypothetical protein GW17_00021904 [Ensete ventricosum]
MFPLRFPNNTNLASRRVLVDFKSRSVIPTRPLGQSSRTLSLGQSRWLQVMAGHTDFASRLVHADFKSWPVPSTSKSRFAGFKSQLVIPTRPLVQSTSASSLGSCCQPQCRPKSQHSQNKADDQATFNHEPHPLESLKKHCPGPLLEELSPGRILYLRRGGASLHTSPTSFRGRLPVIVAVSARKNPRGDAALPRSSSRISPPATASTSSWRRFRLPHRGVGGDGVLHGERRGVRSGGPPPGSPAAPPRATGLRNRTGGTVTRHAPKITYAANTRNPQVDAAAQDSAAPNLSITRSTVLLKQVSSGCAAIRGVQCGQNPPLLVAPNGKQGIGEDSSK